MKSHFLNPSSVAVIGASPNESKMGHYVFRNILQGDLRGNVYPINPKAGEILGVQTYPNVSALPEVPELVVVTTPADTIPGIVEECAGINVPAMIIISAGFREVGESGARLEREILKRKGAMRIAGPNCLGFMSPVNKLNATFASKMARAGNVGVISQSGAILTALLDWAEKHGVGFSNYISLGTMIDYGWHDALYELGADPKTKSILVYMESIGTNAREFVSAAREISAIKPIVALKVGRSPQGAAAAVSHTGAITGNDEVLDAVFRRAGIVRVEEIDELFGMADLARMATPKNNKLTVITNAGGLGVIVADTAAEASVPVDLAPIGDDLRSALDGVLPCTWSRGNPIDIIGDATPERYRKTLELVLAHKDTNAVLVVLSPQVMTDPTAVAQAVIEATHGANVPVFTSWTGGKMVQEARTLFQEANIPTFAYPHTACRMFGYVLERAIRQEALYATPQDATREHLARPMHIEIAQLLRQAQGEGRKVLSEREAKDVLAAYDIPVTRTLVATSVEEAVECADEIGYPVVVKLHSHTITHKTNVGGVRLNLGSADEVRAAYTQMKVAIKEGFEGVTVQPYIKCTGTELIVGSATDPQLGPVVTFGSGGTLVEVLHDVSLGLPPLNRALACQMIQSTRVYTVLKGYRNSLPVDFEALERILVLFSRIITEHQDTIREVEINPLIASADCIIAVDARVVLRDLKEEVVRPAILPYPIHWAHTAYTKDDQEFTVRPIRPDDEERIRVFHAKLSDESVQKRYNQMVPLEERQKHVRLAPRCHLDYQRHMAFVAQQGNDILGVVRMIKLHDGKSAEYSLIVLDEHQCKGIGRILTKAILDWVGRNGMKYVVATTAPENGPMRHLLKSFGFRLKVDIDLVEARLTIR